MLNLAILLLVGAVFSEETSTQKEVKYRQYLGQSEYKLPFMSQLLQPLNLGQTLHVVGTLKEKPVRVDFNFKKDKSEKSDLPLHFSIRFDEASIFSSGKFVYNTFKDGNWSEDEQRISNPFKPGDEFDLRVRMLKGKYQVYANRVDVGTFEQRQDLKGINYVAIKGDLEKLRLFHYGGHEFANPYHAITELVPGKRLDISGYPTGKRFNVNLFNKRREYALQISVRFGEGAIVRNAMTNNVWGEEEREGEMPIESGKVFDLTVVNDEFSFVILFNGKRFATFAHRGSPTDIKTLEIDGEVVIHSVTVNDAV